MADVFLEMRKFANQYHRTVLAEQSKRGILQKSTHMQRILICYLCENEGIVTFQRDLEKKFCIRRSTATTLLNALENKGFIERKAVDYDARLKQIVVTQKGKNLFKKISTDMLEFEQQILQNISESEIQVFLSTLQKLAENLIKINQTKGEGEEI